LTRAFLSSLDTMAAAADPLGEDDTSIGAVVGGGRVGAGTGSTIKASEGGFRGALS
jgi:hypothetical protein